MAGYGFCRVEVYARKSRSKSRSFRTSSEVLDEVERVEGNMPHVANPKKPRVVDGCSIEELRAAHDAVNEATQTLSSGKSRKIRSTQNTLACAVLSYPVAVADLAKGGKEAQDLYYAWRRDAVSFMKKEWGDDYKCAVQHVDEKFPHLHIYAVRDDFDAKENHPGYKAQKEALDAGESQKTAEIAGAYALKDFLNRYHDAVGQKYGMSRHGPKKKRETRKEWVQRQQAADDYADILRNRDAYKEEIRGEVAAEWAETSVVGKVLVAKAKVDEDALKKGVRAAVKKDRIAYGRQFENAEKAVKKSVEKRQKVEKENAALKAENRQFSALSGDYEMRMAQAELVMADTIEGLREVAYEGKSTKAYEKLSSACEHVHETHEADSNVFKSLIKDVRQICKEVRENVPNVFKKFFGWTPEARAEKEARDREVERIREEAKRAAKTAENSQKVERKDAPTPSFPSR